MLGRVCEASDPPRFIGVSEVALTFCEGWVAPEARIGVPSVETSGFFTDEPLTAALGLFDMGLAYPAMDTIEARMATAGTKCFSRIADWRC
jgi:hypothetical protein